MAEKKKNGNAVRILLVADEINSKRSQSAFWVNFYFKLLLNIFFVHNYNTQCSIKKNITTWFKSA